MQAWRNSPLKENQNAFALMGLAKTEKEIAEFQVKMIQYRPYISVMISPSEVVSSPDLPKEWTQHFWWDGVLFGDVVASSWNIYIRSDKPLITLERQFFQYLPSSLYDAALAVQIDLLDSLDSKRYPYVIQHSKGVFNIQHDSSGASFLTTSSNLPPISLKEVWHESWRWPLKADGSSVTPMEKILILGGHPFWRLANGQVSNYHRDDALWRSGPKGLWSHIIREIIDSFGSELDEYQNAVREGRFDMGGDLMLDVQSHFTNLMETDAGIRPGAVLASAESKLTTMLSALAPGTA